MQRSTKQRSAINETLQTSDHPLTPQEILARASQEIPGLGIATVYRALNHLVGEGAVRTVQIPGQPARFERGDLDHHHHFHCTRCNRVFDLDGCALQTNYRVPAGFDVESHDITLSGRCPDCRRGGA